MRFALALIALSAVLTLTLAAPVTPTRADQPEGDGWAALFDGESIDAWTKVTGFATYHIEDGAIVGTTAEGSPNTFLCSPDTYRDFELRFEVMVDDALNSGVQVRSRTNGNANEPHGGRLRGPQVEVEAGPGQAGYIYGEASGGWISPEPESDDPAERQHDHFRNGEWNQYRVLAEGRRIRTWINGTLIADVEVTEDYDSHYGEGVIGLQVHSIGRGTGPYEVRWRELYIREIE
jgi:hypothetical protein